MIEANRKKEATESTKAFALQSGFGSVLFRYRRLFLGVVGFFLIAGLVIPRLMKPHYKAVTVVSISPRYFQNPMIRDFMSETYEPSELRSQRDALVREAFDQPFIDKISGKYGWLKANETPEETSKRRQKVFQNLEIIPLQVTEFQIAALNEKPDIALELARDAVTSIRETLKRARYQTVASLREAVRRQISELLPNGAENSRLRHRQKSPSESRVSSQTAAEKLSNLESRLAHDSQLYAASNPLLTDEKRKIASLKAEIKEQAGQAGSLATAPESGDFTDPEPKALLKTDAGKFDFAQSADIHNETQRAIYQDLLRKLNYLNIVSEMESSSSTDYFSVVKSPELPTSPIGPSQTLVLFWSFLSGLLFALLAVMACEWLGAQKQIAARPPEPKVAHWAAQPGAKMPSHLVSNFPLDVGILESTEPPHEKPRDGQDKF